jgi:hypothetical protein
VSVCSVIFSVALPRKPGLNFFPVSSSTDLIPVSSRTMRYTADTV